MNIFSIVVVAIATCQLSATELPTTSDFIPAIEDFSSEAQGQFSAELAFDGTIGVPSTVNLCWRSKDRYSLLMSEPSTGTPVALFTDEGYFVFDVLSGTMITGTGVTPSLSLHSSNNAIKLKFGYTVDSEVPSQFQLGLKSFLDAEREPRIDNRDGAIQLIQNVGSKSLMTWTFQTGDENKLIGFRIEDEITGQCICRLSRLRCGNSSEYTQFPQVEGVSIPLTNVTRMDGSPQLAARMLKIVMRSAAAQAAASDPRFRDLPTLPSKVDWNIIEKRAAATREGLCSLVDLSYTGK